MEVADVLRVNAPASVLVIVQAVPRSPG